MAANIGRSLCRICARVDHLRYFERKQRCFSYFPTLVKSGRGSILVKYRVVVPFHRKLTTEDIQNKSNIVKLKDGKNLLHFLLLSLQNLLKRFVLFIHFWVIFISSFVYLLKVEVLNILLVCNI